MNQSTSIHNVTFEDVLEVLQEWEVNSLSFDRVQAWAEDLLAAEWHEYDKDDPRSLLAHVIGMLDDMYIKPILKQDIPILRHVLNQALVSPPSAWALSNEFVKSIDLSHRKAQASENIRKFQSPRLDSISDP